MEEIKQTSPEMQKKFQESVKTVARVRRTPAGYAIWIPAEAMNEADADAFPEKPAETIK